jgi:hypothetical protein
MRHSTRAAWVAAALALVSTTALAQRGTMGTIGAPRSGPAPAPAPSSRGVMMVPGYRQPAPSGPTAPVGGNLPRIVPGYGYGNGYLHGRVVGNSYNRVTGLSGGPMPLTGPGFSPTPYSTPGRRFAPGVSHRWQAGYTTTVGKGCVSGCFNVVVHGHSHAFFSSFRYGYPFAYPIFVPYYYDSYSSYGGYAEQPQSEAYGGAAEPAHVSSKLIVIGGGSGNGGDALTVESLGDSVRLSWLVSGRPAREVKLFVADSAQRQLATRVASPAAPTATFELATLSEPVAFVGVTVTFTDGVMTTTTIPYRSTAPVTRPR